MILVAGSARARSATLDEVLRPSTEHVPRSRAEPGCIGHAVHIDSEDAERPVFVERRADIDASRAHLAVPVSRSFGTASAKLAAEAPDLRLYEATEVRL